MAPPCPFWLLVRNAWSLRVTDYEPLSLSKLYPIDGRRNVSTYGSLVQSLSHAMNGNCRDPVLPSMTSHIFAVCVMYSQNTATKDSLRMRSIGAIWIIKLRAQKRNIEKWLQNLTICFSFQWEFQIVLGPAEPVRFRERSHSELWHARPRCLQVVYRRFCAARDVFGVLFSRGRPSRKCLLQTLSCLNNFNKAEGTSRANGASYPFALYSNHLIRNDGNW